MITNTAQEIHRLIAVIEDREWTEFARCQGQVDLFFEPFREQAPQRAIREAAARAMCAQCPAQEPCRDSGRRNHESGIWGGETEEDRVRAGFPIRTVTRASMAVVRTSVKTLGKDSVPARDPEVA
jgi:WhiB family redox-sensing transcriptional regulator